MQNNIEIVISAPSGAGKTTLISRFLSEENNYRFSVSTTTRGMRKGEKEGESYYFVSEDEFKTMIENDKFVEWASVHGNYYGTSKKEVDRIRNEGNIPIFDVDVQGAKALKKSLQSAVFIFIIPPSINELERRLKNRDTDSDEIINLRLKNAINELREYTLFDYIVINDDFNKALLNLRSIVAAELSRKERNTDNIKEILEAVH